LSAFERIDKPLLQKLPATRYEYADWKGVKVQFNYHVEYEGSFYSVPYCYVGQLCSLRATTKTIEIYLDSERIAAHPRNYNSFKRYTTLPVHMPEEHRIVYGWSAKAFLSWAEKIGPNTVALIHSILESREYPVQAYRSCMGVMRLGKTYPAEVMEKASLEALDKNTCSYKYFSILVKQIATAGVRKGPERIVQHDNVRGKDAYAGGGLPV